MTPEEQLSKKLDFTDVQDMKDWGSYLYPFTMHDYDPENEDTDDEGES